MTDLSDVERKRMRGYRHTKNSPKGEIYISKTSDVPSSMNWWLKGKTCLYVYVAFKQVCIKDTNRTFLFLVYTTFQTKYN